MLVERESDLIAFGRAMGVQHDAGTRPGKGVLHRFMNSASGCNITRMNVNVLGAGSWGTALSILLAKGEHQVTLYGRDGEDIQQMSEGRENSHYLAGFELGPQIRPTSSRDLPDADMWVVAVPSGAVREVSRLIRGENPLVVVASKGLEAETASLLEAVVRQELPSARAGVLSGPNLAIEIVRGVPTAAVAAFRTPEDSETVRAAFMCRSFRVYQSSDVKGVELAGALKNVLAIGAGMSDALGYGDNTKGALLARGLCQMAALGCAMGARVETFLGIAGVGDLFATAVSKLSRNYRLGRAVGEGTDLTTALSDLGHVAEGWPTSGAVQVLAAQYKVEMPVFEAIDRVLRGELPPKDAVAWLMERTPKAEVAG